jgi:hypothetical protein
VGDLVDAVEFIPDAGGSIVSQRIVAGSAPLKWAFREEPLNPADNGWRFLSEADDDAYLADPANMVVTSFNTVANLEPLVLGLWGAAVGTDLQYVVEPDGRRVWYDNATGDPWPGVTLSR